MKHTFYSVAPRYTAGSPARVDRETADRVGREEVRAYDIRQALREAAGLPVEANLQERARDLRGIVVLAGEGRKRWECRDLITGELYHVPFGGSIHTLVAAGRFELIA